MFPLSVFSVRPSYISYIVIDSVALVFGCHWQAISGTALLYISCSNRPGPLPVNYPTAGIMNTHEGSTSKLTMNLGMKASSDEYIDDSERSEHNGEVLDAGTSPWQNTNLNKVSLPDIFAELSQDEQFWKDRFHLFQSHGYILRPRYRPGWVASWRTSNTMYLLCEDSLIRSVSSPIPYP